MGAQTPFSTWRRCTLPYEVRKLGLLDDFAFLPAQVLAVALAAFDGCCSVGCAAVPADLLVKPSFLRYGLLHWVEYWHFLSSSFLGPTDRWLAVKYTFCTHHV